MGKKGKKAKKKGRKPPICGRDGETKKSNAKSEQEEETVSQPENGWVIEMNEAAVALKSERNGHSVFRVATAYRKLRLWKKLEDLLTSSFDEIPRDAFGDDVNYKRMKEWLEEAKDNLSVKSALDNFGDIINYNIDGCIMEHPTFNNFNIIHYAAFQGDMRLLERAVALGAALDYPTEETRTDLSGNGLGFKGEYPRGNTALLLACSTLAMHGALPSQTSRLILSEDPELVRRLERILECAVQLVKLGANCSAVLNLDKTSGFVTIDALKSLGINNKNAYQLAAISKKSELIRTMNAFESTKNKISLVHCRCGSRLPWKNCHGNSMLCTSYFSRNEEQDSFDWKLSPFADCPCKNNKKFKKYFKCCWQDLNYYQDDSTGRLMRQEQMPVNDDLTRLMASSLSILKETAASNGVPENAPMFGGMTKQKCISFFRSQPLMMWHAMIRSKDPDGISDLYNWNKDVYVGTMEKIDNWFQWDDLHWPLSKSELLQRVKEWNGALLQYCDDHNLQDAERENVIRIHSASPFAPCANPSCTKIETEVKQFKKCKGCNKVGYCSRNCQKEHWVSHRKMCAFSGHR